MSCNQTGTCSNKKGNNCTNSYAFVLVLFILIALVGSAWAR